MIIKVNFVWKVVPEKQFLRWMFYFWKSSHSSPPPALQWVWLALKDKQTDFKFYKKKRPCVDLHCTPRICKCSLSLARDQYLTSRTLFFIPPLSCTTWKHFQIQFSSSDLHCEVTGVYRELFFLFPSKLLLDLSWSEKEWGQLLLLWST